MKIVKATNGDLINCDHIIRFSAKGWCVDILKKQILAYDIHDHSYIIFDDLSDDVCEDRMKRLKNYLKGVDE